MSLYLYMGHIRLMMILSINTKSKHSNLFALSVDWVREHPHAVNEKTTEREEKDFCYFFIEKKYCWEMQKIDHFKYMKKPFFAK